MRQKSQTKTVGDFSKLNEKTSEKFLREVHNRQMTALKQFQKFLPGWG